MKQYTILTKNGLNKLISASANQTTIKLKYMAVGDGSGEINQDATALQNERHRFAINAITINQNDSNILEVEGVLQADIGGFYVREAGIFCDDGSLFAIAKVAESYKPLLAEGSAKDITISFQIQISNTNLINLKVDNNVVLATRKWVLANFSPLSHTHDEYLKMYQKLPRGDYSSEVFWNGIDTGFYSYHPEIGGSNAPYGHGVVLVMSAGVNSTTKHILWFAADSKGSCYERRQSGGVVIDWRPLGQSIYDDRYLKKRSSKLPNGDTRTSNYWSGVEPGLYFTGSGDSGVTNRPIINGVFHVATWGGGAADKVILAYPATDERKIFKLFFTGAGQSRNWVEISETQAFLAFNQASKAQNGYQKLPSGVIIQWGSVEADRSSLKQKTRINFPIAFPNSCFSISLATRVKQGNENANAYFSIYSKSNAYAEAVLDNYTPDCSDIKGFDYMAIGH